MVVYNFENNFKHFRLIEIARMPLKSEHSMLKKNQKKKLFYLLYFTLIG